MTPLAIVLFALAACVYVAIGLGFIQFYPLANSLFDYVLIVLTWPFMLALVGACVPFVLAYKGVHRLIQRMKGA